MPDFIVVENLNMIYENTQGRLPALSDLSLSVPEGEIVVIVGPSGCGKTTLLRLLAGIITPTSGTVRVGGSSPGRYRKSEGVGYAFQKPVLFPWRTVLENVLLPTEVGKRMDSQAALARARQLLSVLGLANFEQSSPSQLSGGMAQRAAVARAIITNPNLLLLDEPFGALDELTREQLWFDFAAMWTQERPTVVLVTHSIREAAFLGDRVIILSPRPGCIRGTVCPGIRNRVDPLTLTNPNFVRVCEQIKHILRQA